ncbi:MAG: protein putative AbiEii toxin, Type system [Segetibacter sp.]|nr:protein putative AbiEii toxin, Type system [Segetibacter sp.]
MFFFFRKDIPPQLLSSSNTDEDVNIIIGENGSGKSTLLNELAKFYLSGNANVIAIANSIYDKFPYNKKLKVQRATYGKTLAKKIIKTALVNLANDELKRLNNVANTLTYIGFEPVIGLQLKGIDKDFRNKVVDSDLPSNEKENLLYFLNRFTHDEVKEGDILRINFTSNSFKDIRNSYIVTLFLYEKQLKSLKLVKGISIFLRKRGEDVPLLKASSGEITLATTLIYITSIITERSIILIDEPENSLHPKWQTEYIKRLSELFYYYQPKIVVATHSPLILNGAEVSSNKINVFKGVNGKFELHQNPTTNVEEIYQDFFDITTPENRYISEEIVEKMNLLSEKEISEEQFQTYIEEIKSTSYDEKQKEALDGVIELSKEMVQEIK